MGGFKRACAARGAAAILAAFLGWSLSSAPAAAVVQIDIDLTKQRMVVADKRGAKHVWPISSARRGYVTPRGQFRPTVLRRMHYSRKYDNAPMPHSIFFRGGYAIHGTNAVGQLGRPASHGCVRLAPGAAARLFAMVKRDGARIRITGAPPHLRSADAAEVSPQGQLALAAVAEEGVTQVARGRESGATDAGGSQETHAPRVVLLAPDALVAFDAQGLFDMLEISAGADLEDFEMEDEAPAAPAREGGGGDVSGWALRGRD